MKIDNFHFRQLLLFSLVGGFGFIVDSAFLYILKPCLGLYISRFLSFLIAVLVTWILNRMYTFNDLVDVKKGRAHEFVVYLFLMCIGGSVNILTYVVFIYNVKFVSEAPILGVAIGSLAGLVFNFISSKVFLYKSKRNVL